MPYVSTCIVIHGKENDVVLLCTQRQEEESADVLPEMFLLEGEEKKNDRSFVPLLPPSSRMTMLRRTMCVNYGVKNHCLTFLLTFINYFLKK